MGIIDCLGEGWKFLDLLKLLPALYIQHAESKRRSNMFSMGNQSSFSALLFNILIPDQQAHALIKELYVKACPPFPFE